QNTLVFYAKGTTDQTSPIPGEVIRTLINKDTATIVHPAKGIEIIRMDIQPSDVCIQTQATVCFDGIITDTRNVDVHKIGDKIGIMFDFQNKKQIITFDSGSMQEISFTVDLSKTIVRLDGPLTVTLTQEGGFAGMQNTFVIDTASAQLTKNDSIIMLDEDSINEITSSIKKIKLFDVDEESYPPIEGSADYFTYLIQITHGPFQKTVSWTDTSEVIPENLNALKDVIITTSNNIQTSDPAPDVIQAELAIDFVKNAPTFAFDGVDDSLTVEDVMILESFPVQYVITINFESSHGGYGDRTGQFLTQAITPHTIIVTVVDGQITSAIIDDAWDEVNQEMFVNDFNDGTIGEFWGSIYGMVLLGPTCPVVSDPPDPECADKPYQTNLVVTNTDQSRVIKEFSSDEDGKFYVDVPPGEYTISSAAAANVLPYCSSDTIEVDINSGVEVTVFCDTGIR
ncbi:MAG TPA: hypothetical protein VD828_02415, partial [Candidatus Nitrosotenuis sp.]|nr:hypothetical protein [Candidatus Nitrosotenuis sp.]